MQKAILKVSNTLGTAVLTLALVAVFGTLAKAEETKANLRAENQKAVDKLVETAPTDQELIGNVSLVKHSHRVEEPFSCSVALADRAELRKQLSNSKNLSQERRNKYSSTLTTVTSLIREHGCKG